jgi:uncharacterized protein (DUF2235 family)
MAKNIVFCADGTWNNPNQDENSEQSVGPTNVYKLFLCLDGALSPDSLLSANEQEKELTTVGATQQISKYIHGVGDSRNPIIKLLGGAFGAGVIARIVRGYTFISRNYEPGANIFVVGFSRGAYTARALVGLIVSQGVLTPHITQDKELAYRRGAEAWYRYRKTTISNPFSLAQLADIVTDLPGFLSHRSLQDSDLIPVDRISAVAVWDTVGALGIPLYVARGKRVDAFEFCDTLLSQKVARGFHAVALDERRNDFTPTLWDAALNVLQVLFPGAHSDVGGGYPVSNDECGLSDGALQWMITQLTGVGVLFSTTPAYECKPKPTGISHKPWLHAPWNLPSVSLGARSFPQGMPQDPSIAVRMAAGNVVAEPGEPPAFYQPTNRP